MYSAFRNTILVILKLFRYIFISIPRDFNVFRETPFEKFQNESIQNSYNHFKNYFKKAIFLKGKKIKSYAILKSLELDNQGLFLEFGVHKGASINFFSKLIKNQKIYGFDSFEGLHEDWKGTQQAKGTFDLKGKIPKLNANAIPIKGWIQDTLPNFISSTNKKINFAHVDVDTYETTLFILKTIKPYLNKGAILIFDELYNYINWEENEYKALIEVFNNQEYEYLAFSKEGAQVVIRYF
jgi:hypothetical protein